MKSKFISQIIETANNLDNAQEYISADVLTKVAMKVAETYFYSEDSYKNCDSLMHDPLMMRYRMLKEEDPLFDDEEIEYKLIMKIDKCLSSTDLFGQGKQVLDKILETSSDTLFSDVLKDMTKRNLT